MLAGSWPCALVAGSGRASHAAAQRSNRRGAASLVVPYLRFPRVITPSAKPAASG